MKPFLEILEEKTDKELIDLAKDLQRDAFPTFSLSYSIVKEAGMLNHGLSAYIHLGYNLSHELANRYEKSIKMLDQDIIEIKD